MDGILTEGAKQLLSQGVLGLFVLALAVAYYRSNQAHIAAVNMVAEVIRTSTVAQVESNKQEEIRVRALESQTQTLALGVQEQARHIKETEKIVIRLDQVHADLLTIHKALARKGIDP